MSCRYEGYKVFESMGIVVPKWKLFDNKKDDPVVFAKELPMDGIYLCILYSPQGPG